jgi:hypothetical protein
VILVIAIGGIMNKTYYDLQNKIIKLNDYVAYSRFGSMPSLDICQVVGFTAKGIKIKKPREEKPTVVYNSEFAMIVLNKSNLTKETIKSIGKNK